MTYERMSERGLKFACALIDEFRMRRPTDDAERAIWGQLLDSGPSIGANASESDGAESGRDFSHKFHVSLKEGRETLYWLRILRYASPDRARRVDVLYRECDEMVAILVTSIKTSKRNEAARQRGEVSAPLETETEGGAGERNSARKRRSKEFWFNVPD